MKPCPVCSKNIARNHPIYGVLPCGECTDARKTNALPDIQVEFSGEDIKQQRSAYARSIIQPYRSGILSKEYLDLYGKKHINPSKKDIKNARNVWKDTYSHNFDLKKSH